MALEDRIQRLEGELDQTRRDLSLLYRRVTALELQNSTLTERLAEVEKQLPRRVETIVPED